MKFSVLSVRVLSLAALIAVGCSSGSHGQGPGDASQVDAPSVIDAPKAPLDAPKPVDAAADAAADAAVQVDAALPDAYLADAAMPDAPQVDAAMPDAYVPPVDAAVDAPQVDAAMPDAYVPPVDASVDAPQVDAATPDAYVPPPDAYVPPTSPTNLRLMAGNITSGNGQSYQLPGIHIFKGVQPDIAMIQEFNVGGNSASEIRTFIDQAFGTEYVFARGAASQQIPNGVVSRYPILASGEWTDSEVGNRAFVWARIDIPGPIDLYAISVHLLTSNSGDRNSEATQLVQRILSDIPAGAYVALGGDFNTDTRTESCVSTLSQVFTTTGPYPVDLNNNANTNANRNKPYDWVLVSPSLHAKKATTQIGNNAFANGFVADTRVYTPISDLAPAVASDSGASMMQHMGVVRDFTVDGGTTAPTVKVLSPNGGETWGAGQTQQISWSSSGVSNVSVELSLDGSTWTTLASSVPASQGQLSVTAPAAMTSTALVRVTAVPGGSPNDVSDAPFMITIAPPPVGRVFINEVLANEPGSDVTQEFIEIVNSGNTSVNISGWTLSDAASVRHTFAAGTVLAAGKAIVVFGDVGGIPAGLTNAVGASTKRLDLSNSGDTVTLKNGASSIDSMTYTGSQPENDSRNRSPDGDATGAFVLHSTLSTTLTKSPGVRVTGAAF